MLALAMTHLTAGMTQPETARALVVLSKGPRNSRWASHIAKLALDLIAKRGMRHVIVLRRDRAEIWRYHGRRVEVDRPHVVGVYDECARHEDIVDDLLAMA